MTGSSAPRKRSFRWRSPAYAPSVSMLTLMHWSDGVGSKDA